MIWALDLFVCLFLRKLCLSISTIRMKGRKNKKIMVHLAQANILYLPLSKSLHRKIMRA